MEVSIEERYPIGKFKAPEKFDETSAGMHIKDIETFPEILREETENLGDEQLDTRYREGGWTIRQVVHHLADSHINAYCRFRLALTEDNPVIKPYHEDRWAELTDARSSPVRASLNLIEALHYRWTILMQNMKPEDFRRTFFHPESQRKFPLYVILALYSWHCAHHLAHITRTRERNGW